MYTFCFSLYQRYCRRVLCYTTTVKARDDRSIAKTSKPRGSIDTIEDRAIYSKLEKFGVDMDSAKAATLRTNSYYFCGIS
jgi:hypothetical protein